MNKNLMGFTLIELMIVVAIIGILASIAVPVYQGYIARSQMTRTVGEISGFKSSIESMLTRGDNPTNGTELGYTNSDLIGNDHSVLESGLTIDFTSGDGSGFINALLNGDVTTTINGAQVRYSRSQTGTWTCTIIAPANPGWQNSFVPTGCSVS